nr:dicarboxylate transporter 1, chloroplastic [Tanacetum cinerariifolium]
PQSGVPIYLGLNSLTTLALITRDDMIKLIRLNLSRAQDRTRNQANSQRSNLVLELLISWSNRPIEEATWESYDLLQEQFPNFGLEDKSFYREGRFRSLHAVKNRHPLNLNVRSNVNTRLMHQSFSPLTTKLPLPLLNGAVKKTINFTVKASSSTAVAPSTPPPVPWQGAAMKPLLASIATGVIIWFIPVPNGVTKIAWQLLSIFLATIVGIITQPLPLGAVALMGLGACVLTKTLTFAAAFSAFGDPIPWLIALAFFFARGFIKTGLGNRIAYQFVKLFGSSSLGLGYSLVFSEALLAPAIPSVSARAGGIFLPLVKSLCVACGSNNEIIMAGTLLLTVGLWIFGGMVGIDAVTAAILGLSVLLITGVVTWKECLGEAVAWDTLTCGAAHIGAMFTAFLSVASALGTPPLLGAMVLAFLSNLMGGLTHYGIGSAPVFYGANYVPLGKWWGYGFIISVVNIIIWLGVGGVWWKFLGLW